MVTKKTVARKQTRKFTREEPRQSFMQKWGLISVIIAIIGVGSGAITFLYKTFPTNSYVEDVYAKTIDLFKTRNELSTKILTDNMEVAQTIQEQRTQDRVDRLEDLVQRLILVEKQLQENPNSKALQDYKKVLENRIDILKSKITGK